jgi:hypothetical protein
MGLRGSSIGTACIWRWLMGVSAAARIGRFRMGRRAESRRFVIGPLVGGWLGRKEGYN